MNQFIFTEFSNFERTITTKQDTNYVAKCIKTDNILETTWNYFEEKNFKNNLIIFVEFSYNEQEFKYMVGFPESFLFKGIEYYLRFDEFKFGKTKEDFALVFGSWENKDEVSLIIPSNEFEFFIPNAKSDNEIIVPTSSIYSIFLDKIKHIKIPQTQEDFKEPYEFGYSDEYSTLRLSNNINIQSLDDIYQVLDIDNYGVIFEKHTKNPIGYFDDKENIGVEDIIFRDVLFKTQFYAHLSNNNKVAIDLQIPVLKKQDSDLGLSIEYGQSFLKKTGFLKVNDKFLEVIVSGFTKEGLCIFSDRSGQQHYAPINQLLKKV